jgi:hypothetical protein
MSDKNFIVKNGMELGGTVNTVLTADNSGGLLVDGNAVGLPALIGSLTITFSDYVESSYTSFSGESPLNVGGLSVATLNLLSNGTNFTISNNAEVEAITTVFTKTGNAYDSEGTKVPVTYVSGNSTFENNSSTWTIVGTGSASGKFLTNNGTFASWASVPAPTAATPTVQGIVYGKETSIDSVTAYGYSALSNSSATNTVAIGRYAGTNISTGQQNTAVGVSAMQNLSTSSYNTAVGHSAMVGDGSGTGTNNTAIGSNTLSSITTGTSNTVVGSESGGLITTGTNNTVVGGSAGTLISTGSNLTVVGRGAAPSSATTSNEITLGNSDVARLRVPGLAIDWVGRGPGMTVIASGNFPTNATRVNLTGIPSTYVDLYLVMENPFTTQNAQQFYIRPNDNTTSSSYYLQTQNNGATSFTNSTSNAFDLGGFGILSNSNNQRLSLIFKAYNYKSTNSQKMCEFFGSNTSQFYFQRGIANALSTTAITSLSIIIANSLNFSGGSYVLYGVK